MSPLNLALRFALEVAALAGIFAGVQQMLSMSSTMATLAAAAAVLLAMVCWGVFNVEGDPSRSGRAPVAVAGGVRLSVELAVFAAGAAGWSTSSLPVAGTFVGLTVVHLVASHRRLRWLLRA